MRCLNGEILQWGVLEKILLHKVGSDKKSLRTYALDNVSAVRIIRTNRGNLNYINKCLQ